MTFETLIYEVVEPGVGLVTFNRPRRANAMSQQMLRELDTLCQRLESDPNLRVVVVTGAGPAFCSGFDLKDQAEAMPQGVRDWVPLLEADLKGILSFWKLSRPTIAAVNGPALAGGFELMLACDLAIASDQAVFGEPELRFGAGIVAMILPWYVGPRVAKELIYTGDDRISPARALELGLVNRVVPPDEVLPASLDLARKLARLEPMVLQRTKQALHRTYEVMGMPLALRSALEIDMLIEGEGTETKREFLRVIREQGLGKALAWREARYHEPG